MPEENTRYDSTRVAWEEIWDQSSIELELEAVRYARAQEIIRAYLPFLAKEDLHLEAGSGLSAVVISLRELGYQVHGLDYAQNALRDSRRFDATLPLTAGDVHRLPYRDDCFGSYLSFGVLEHFEHGMLPALKEARRVVEPGGVLVLTIPISQCRISGGSIQAPANGRRSAHHEAFYESVYTRRQLIDIVSQAGFREIRALPHQPLLYVMGLGGLFRKPGYYRTNALAEALGALLKRGLPWAFNFSTLIIARK